MSRIRIAAISLLLVLLVSIGFLGGVVALAFNPQPEPPAQCNKLEAMKKQLDGLYSQLTGVVPVAIEPGNDGYEALEGVRDSAQAIVNYADSMLDGIGY